MRRVFAFIVATCFFSAVTHAANMGFGLDAFNRAVSAAFRGNVAFSPSSFEFDCVVFSEAFDAITRAKIAETMGVLNGLETVYSPIASELSNLGGESVCFRNARAFCLPDERKTHVAYRKWIQESFSAEAFSYDFRKGAECWFRTRVDGAMEDFVLSEQQVSARQYSFFDLVFCKCSFALPASSESNTVYKAEFITESGEKRATDYFSVSLTADAWLRKNHMVLRLPIDGNLSFFVILPVGNRLIREVRSSLTSNTINDILAGISSITEEGIAHRRFEIHLPVVDIDTDTDLRLAFRYFNIPMSGMERMDPNLTCRKLSQRVRFQLSSHNVASVETNSCESVVTPTKPIQKLCLNRPFLYFVFYEPTKSIPIVGQFTGQ